MCLISIHYCVAAPSMRFQGQRDPWCLFPGDVQFESGSGPWTGCRFNAGLSPRDKQALELTLNAYGQLETRRSSADSGRKSGLGEQENTHARRDTNTSLLICIDIHTFRKYSNCGALLTKQYEC